MTSPIVSSSQIGADEEGKFELESERLLTKDLYFLAKLLVYEEAQFLSSTAAENMNLNGADIACERS